MINIPSAFKPTINTIYPPNNLIEFERWFGENYKQSFGDREYLGIYWCAYQVNNNYGQDKKAMIELQNFIDDLPRDKKYFTISQYDDGCGVDFRDLDVLRFDMSKTGFIDIPLIGQPHPYKFIPNKKWLVSFVGSKTHPVREKIKVFEGMSDCYISFESHDPETYCRILNESIFCLCPRGYGANSFRISEAVQYKSIPVYYSDDFIIRSDCNFEKFGLLIKENEDLLNVILSINNSAIIEKQQNLEKAFDKYFSYQSVYNYIVNVIEHNNWKQVREDTTAL